MVNEEILGGLKSALERRQSLRRAMMTFYNAGYKRNEIEEAARTLRQGETTSPQVQEKKPEIPEKKKSLTRKTQEKKPSRRISTYGEEPQKPISKPPQKQKEVEKPKQKQIQQPKQKVSEYKETKKPAGNLIIILLIVFLCFLLGALATIIFFRQELMSFFGRVF